MQTKTNYILGIMSSIISGSMVRIMFELISTIPISSVYRILILFAAMLSMVAVVYVSLKLISTIYTNVRRKYVNYKEEDITKFRNEIILYIDEINRRYDECIVEIDPTKKRYLEQVVLYKIELANDYLRRILLTLNNMREDKSNEHYLDQIIPMHECASVYLKEIKNRFSEKTY